jgi:hypothetical protein
VSRAPVEYVHHAVEAPHLVDEGPSLTIGFRRLRIGSGWTQSSRKGLQMKVDEAAKKWCPFGMLSDGIVHASFNRGRHDHAAGHFYSNCLASECMAWRWERSAAGKKTSSGYCGLAGTEKEPSK